MMRKRGPGLTSERPIPRSFFLCVSFHPDGAQRWRRPHGRSSTNSTTLLASESLFSQQMNATDRTLSFSRSKRLAFRSRSRVSRHSIAPTCMEFGSSFTRVLIFSANVFFILWLELVERLSSIGRSRIPLNHRIVWWKWRNGHWNQPRITQSVLCGSHYSTIRLSCGASRWNEYNFGASSVRFWRKWAKLCESRVAQWSDRMQIEWIPRTALMESLAIIVFWMPLLSFVNDRCTKEVDDCFLLPLTWFSSFIPTDSFHGTFFFLKFRTWWSNEGKIWLIEIEKDIFLERLFSLNTSLELNTPTRFVDDQRREKSCGWTWLRIRYR